MPTIAVAAALLGATVAPGASHAAVPTCPGHCYGIVRYNQYDNLEAVGGNLSVSCLHVPNRSSQFVNMEMWLLTRADRNPSNPAVWNWVESGMTAGTLWSSPGREVGFIWYWADAYVDTGAYFEHYIGPASVNTATNVSFYWEKNGSGIDGWGVYKGGSRVGWSGVGPYPGYVDLGGESTDGKIAVWGDAFDWQFRDKARNWHWITGSPVWVGNAILSNVPATARASVWTPYWVCGGAPPSVAGATQEAQTAAEEGAKVRSLMQSDAGMRQHLKSEAGRVAQSLGKANLGGARYVKSTRGAALRHNGSTEVTDDRPVYVVQLDGTFTKESKHHANVSGTVLEVVVDATTGEVTDWGTTSSARNLGSLGSAGALA